MAKGKTGPLSAYLLTAYDPVETDGRGPRRFARCPDGASVELRRQDCGVFSSPGRVEDAVEKMVEARRCEIGKKWTKLPWFGFEVIEFYVDDPWHPDPGCVGYPVSFRSFCTYLGDGTLNYFSDTDEAGLKPFVGTRSGRRFKKGGFAWKLCWDRAVPTLVEEEPLSREEWKKRFKSGVKGDFTDDSGIDFPYEGGGHQHSFAPLLFPLSALPGATIPAAAKASMRDARRRWREDGV
jgi:hypothetical protein